MQEVTDNPANAERFDCIVALFDQTVFKFDSFFAAMQHITVCQAMVSVAK